MAAEPAAGHHALRQLHDAGRLLRHYTLNIDGLAEHVGAGQLGDAGAPGCVRAAYVVVLCCAAKGVEGCSLERQGQRC